ncbi:MAG TPA: hypothetical protein VGM56_15455 [Byssovorax sp.]|jgi:hypothetical protein
MQTFPRWGRERPCSPTSLRLARFAALGLVLAACTATDGPGAKNAGGLKRDTEMTHEPCDAGSSSAVKIDVNGDGKPDIIHVMSGQHELCRVIDLNLDGTVDAYIYYDDQGKERRRESDFDRDGRVDEIALSKDGHVYLKIRETNFDNKADTWDYYENDRIVRRERDSDGDGIIDQWWTFGDPANPKCATVATDRNGDGKPDPDTVVDLCGEQYNGPKPAGAAAPKASAAPAASAAPSAAPAAAAATPPPVSLAASAAPAVKAAPKKDKK